MDLKALQAAIQRYDLATYPDGPRPTTPAVLSGAVRDMAAPHLLPTLHDDQERYGRQLAGGLLCILLNYCGDRGWDAGDVAMDSFTAVCGGSAFALEEQNHAAEHDTTPVPPVS
jgi:hypothetical protein